MQSIRDTAWWTDLVTRVSNEALNDLADEVDADIESVESALAELDDGGAITDTPAWPEIVRRVVAGRSLRDTARRFRTSPRRIRRGLARTAVRVRGNNLGEAGLPLLHDFERDLGKVPDGAIAERAGVAVEAVQGERHRLGIPAFRPRPAVRRSRENERPEKPIQRRTRPQKIWQRDEVPTQVVHRPARRRVEPTERVLPTKLGFAQGLQLPTLRPHSDQGAGGGPPKKGAGSDAGRRRGLRRRVVVRNDVDPIAAAIESTKVAEQTPRKRSTVRREPEAPPRTDGRSRRRRVVSRSSTSSGASDVEPAPAVQCKPDSPLQAAPAPQSTETNRALDSGAVYSSDTAGQAKTGGVASRPTLPKSTIQRTRSAPLKRTPPTASQRKATPSKAQPSAPRAKPSMGNAQEEINASGPAADASSRTVDRPAAAATKKRSAPKATTTAPKATAADRKATTAAPVVSAGTPLVEAATAGIARPAKRPPSRLPKASADIDESSTSEVRTSLSGTMEPLPSEGLVLHSLPSSAANYARASSLSRPVRMNLRPTRRALRVSALPTVGVPSVPKTPTVVPATRRISWSMRSAASRVASSPSLPVSPVPQPAASDCAAPASTPHPTAAETAAPKRVAPKKAAPKKAAPKKAAPKKAAPKKAAPKKAAPKKAVQGTPPPTPAAAFAPAVSASPPRSSPAKPTVVVDSTRLHAIAAGVNLVQDSQLKPVEGGLTGPGVPEIWRVGVGGERLPIVALAYSMFDAIRIVAPHLKPKQLQALSVWSDGPAD